jgi:transposase-like protein
MVKNTIYTSEFKKEAVKLAQSSNQPVRVIAEELGVKTNTLYNWMSIAMKKRITANKSHTKLNYSYGELEQENKKLKKDLKRVQPAFKSEVRQNPNYPLLTN